MQSLSSSLRNLGQFLLQSCVSWSSSIRMAPTAACAPGDLCLYLSMISPPRSLLWLLFLRYPATGFTFLLFPTALLKTSLLLAHFDLLCGYNCLLVPLKMRFAAFFLSPLLVLHDLWEVRGKTDFTVTSLGRTHFLKLFLAPFGCWLLLFGCLCWTFFRFLTSNCWDSTGFSLEFLFYVCVPIQSQELIFLNDSQIFICSSNLSTEPQINIRSASQHCHLGKLLCISNLS